MIKLLTNPSTGSSTNEWNASTRDLALLKLEYNTTAHFTEPSKEQTSIRPELWILVVSIPTYNFSVTQSSAIDVTVSSITSLFRRTYAGKDEFPRSEVNLILPLDDRDQLSMYARTFCKENEFYGLK